MAAQSIKNSKQPEALLQEMVDLAKEVIIAEGNDLVHATLRAFSKHCESWELEDSIGTRGQLVLNQIRGKDLVESICAFT